MPATSEKLSAHEQIQVILYKTVKPPRWLECWIPVYEKCVIIIHLCTDGIFYETQEEVLLSREQTKYIHESTSFYYGSENSKMHKVERTHV